MKVLRCLEMVTMLIVNLFLLYAWKENPIQLKRILKNFSWPKCERKKEARKKNL